MRSEASGSNLRKSNTIHRIICTLSTLWKIFFSRMLRCTVQIVSIICADHCMVMKYNVQTPSSCLTHLCFSQGIAKFSQMLTSEPLKFIFLFILCKFRRLDIQNPFGCKNVFTESAVNRVTAIRCLIPPNSNINSGRGQNQLPTTSCLLNVFFEYICPLTLKFAVCAFGTRAGGRGSWQDRSG